MVPSETPAGNSRASLPGRCSDVAFAAIESIAGRLLALLAPISLTERLPESDRGAGDDDDSALVVRV